MSDDLYEIRNYHYDPAHLDAYRTWARDEAVPYIRSQVDLVGFWVTGDEAPELRGAPQDELGVATVTWIIRWPDKATRDASFAQVFRSEQWADIMSRNPGQEHYLRMEAKFTEAL